MGKKLSDETKCRISESNRGKLLSEETKEKMRNAKLGKKRPPRLNVEKEDI